MAHPAPEQQYAWEQIVRWSIQADVRFALLRRFMEDSGVRISEIERLQKVWLTLSHNDRRFTQGER